MIAGRIVVHKEPQRYKAPEYSGGWNKYSGLGEDLDGYSWIDRNYQSSYKPTFTEQMLLSLLNKATCEGFVVGARVSRASGNPGIGTITQIHRDFKLAYDDDNREFTPFKVTWDFSPVFVGGTFDYSMEDLKLVSTPSLPLLEYTNNETVSNLHVAC